MERVLFISDLHLTPARPASNAAFFAFVEHEAAASRGLWVLGDLFEYWIGDDDLGEPLAASVASAFARLAARGVPVRLMHGNRDFLLGTAFCAAAGATAADDPSLVELYGMPTLLMHGDTLCTDDRVYQAFRREVRTDAWQREFLAAPLGARRERIEALRRRSEAAKQTTAAEIMDVNEAAVREAFAASGARRLIHGHTHRPARHAYPLSDGERERWVLPAWYEGGGYLEVDAAGARLVALSSTS